MKMDRCRLAWSVALLTVVSGVALTLVGASTVQSSQDDQKTAQSAAPAVSSTGDASCLSDPAVLTEINKRKQDLDQRERDLSARETELKAREGALGDEMAKLQATRDEIAGLESSQKKENADKVAKIVQTIEGMSPKAAAQMLSALDDGLAVEAISQMSTAKLSKVMNTLDPKRAAKLTELLAGVVRAKDETDASNGAAVATNRNTEKGGESNDKQYDKQPESIISGGPEQFAGRGPTKTGQGAIGRQ